MLVAFVLQLPPLLSRTDAEFSADNDCLGMRRRMMSSRSLGHCFRRTIVSPSTHSLLIPRAKCVLWAFSTFVLESPSLLLKSQHLYRYFGCVTARGDGSDPRQARARDEVPWYG